MLISIIIKLEEETWSSSEIHTAIELCANDLGYSQLSRSNIKLLPPLWKGKMCSFRCRRDSLMTFCFAPFLQTFDLLKVETKASIVVVVSPLISIVDISMVDIVCQCIDNYSIVPLKSSVRATVIATIGFERDSDRVSVRKMHRYIDDQSSHHTVYQSDRQRYFYLQRDVMFPA